LLFQLSCAETDAAQKSLYHAVCISSKSLENARRRLDRLQAKLLVPRPV